MTDLKSRIMAYFYTRKKHFIINKAPLTIFLGKDRFDISAEWESDKAKFKIDHGIGHIYLNDVDAVVEFIEKHEDKKC